MPTNPQKLFCEIVAKFTTFGEMFIVMRLAVALDASVPFEALLDVNVPRTSGVDEVDTNDDPIPTCGTVDSVDPNPNVWAPVLSATSVAADDGPHQTVA